MSAAAAPERGESLQGLTKSYQEREVLQVESLNVQQGEIFGIMGPSGSGKSTLLRLLHFLEEPSSGSISFEGTPVRLPLGDHLPLRRRITMVFQRPLLFNASVWDNVAYGLRVRGEATVDSRVSQALEEVGLLPLARKNASTLSGGETQRVALARALVLETEVLLLDEPTANLDPYNVSLIERLVARVNQQRCTTAVLVTHNVFQARRLAHRVMLLLEGRQIEVGETEQVFAHPRDPRTASFIRGEMVY